MKSSAKYYTNKIFWYILTFIVAILLNFGLPRLIPGNPISGMVAAMSVYGGAGSDSLANSTIHILRNLVLINLFTFNL